ncbi:MAG: hypothetical protein HY812_06710 [Planctomycetes bacterium]|nr:hypothetical protein [Planctomycetota bacterium]
MRNRLPLAAALAVLAACATTAPVVHLYDLAAAPPPAAAAQLPLTLRVEPFTARAGRDQHEFAYGAAGRLYHHDLHRWLLRPSEAALRAALEGLRAAGCFLRVDGPGGGSAADLVLAAEVVRFEQVFAGERGEGASVALVEIEARLARTRAEATAAPLILRARGEEAIGAPDREGDRRGVRDALEQALSTAIAELCASVAQGAASLAEEPAPRAAPAAAAEIDLRAVAGIQPLALARPVVVRFGGILSEGSLDRLEVLRRVSEHRCAADTDLRWLRPPSCMAGDLLQDALRAALGAQGSVRQSGEDGLEVGGVLRMFALDVTREPAEALVELAAAIGGASELLVEREPLADSSAEAVAAAFEAALARVAARVVLLLEREISAAAPVAAEPEPPEQRLALRWRAPAEVQLRAARGSARVARLEVRSGLNRLEVLRRVSEHVVEADPALRWERYPGEVATDALLHALQESGAFPGGTAGPGAASVHDFEVRGVLTSFHLELQEGSWRADVSMELEVERRALSAEAGPRAAAGPLRVQGTADLAGRTGEEVAAAMSLAVTRALEAAVVEVSRAAAELLAGG